MTNDECDTLNELGEKLLGITVALTRTDSIGRGSGVVIPWDGTHRVVTARHVIEQGHWAIETNTRRKSGLRRLTEATLGSVPLDERRTLCLRLKADINSFDATTHDIAWATFDFDSKSLANDPFASESELGVYRGPLDRVPIDTEPYTFAATNRDEFHVGFRAMVRAVAAEAYMRYLREEPDGLRFELAREHQGHGYYRGSSGAPVVDRSGAVVGVVCRGCPETNELVIAGLAGFISTMRARS